MLSKTLLEVILFFEIFLAYGFTPYDNNYNNYFSSSAGAASYYREDSLNIAVSTHQDTSQLFSASLTLQGPGFSGGNQFAQFSQANQFQSLFPQAPLPDPSTAQGCGMTRAGCAQTRYHSHDGTWNNLRNPVFGPLPTPYVRFLLHNYSHDTRVLSYGFRRTETLPICSNFDVTKRKHAYVSNIRSERVKNFLTTSGVYVERETGLTSFPPHQRERALARFSLTQIIMIVYASTT